MIEVNMLWDLVPGVDNPGYLAWAKKAIGTSLQQPGIIELRANRNVLGTPQIRVVTVWSSGAEWFKYEEGAWQALEQELRKFATSYKVQIWGPSPVIPEPLHHAK